ncbi:site-specific integrase [Tessaracoccus defluvii]|uniref:Site-specific integrase n=1 Tax=Tessaracoccus defluvii TaxID=1285901 RepID=A0A7H0H4R7_9ACTN|nr:site-specific integrase [Tessaracoccus defluvii]QNP55533.1 site-specific integrase [Tessaracoccus defluvii]
MNDRSLVPVDASLDVSEAVFAQAARAPSTLRGYRSDWREFTTWCDLHGFSALPADDVAISRYISELAVAGAKVGTISRRLSSIKFAHKVRNQADPTQTARVLTVWEGVR